MKTIPLFGAGIASYANIVTRQRRVNCMYDVRADQDRAATVVVGTPGSTVHITLPVGPIRGWHVIVDSLYVVAGTNLYRVNPDTSYTLLAKFPSLGGDVGMADNSLQLIMVDGAKGYVYTLATGVLTQITDVHFPNGATSVAFLNGRFIVNKPGTREFYVSQLLDGLNWTYLDSVAVYGTKENSSDLLLKVGVLNGVLVLWGQTSIEFWQDVGSSPLPYQRINGATQTWGLAAIDSNVKVGNTELFLGRSPDGGIQVIMLNGYSTVPVSTSDLDYLISNFSAVDDAVGLCYTAFGHPVYQITFPDANRSFAFDLKTQLWHEAQTGLDLVGRHFANLGIAYNNRNYVSDDTTGTIYLLDEDTYDDHGYHIPREVCTRHLRNDGNYVYLTQLMLDFETGVGITGVDFEDTVFLSTEDSVDLITESGYYIEASTSSNNLVNPKVFISISRDGGNTFGYEKMRSLGRIGSFLTRVVFNRLGSGRDMVIRIRVTDAVKFLVTSGSASVETAIG